MGSPNYGGKKVGTPWWTVKRVVFHHLFSDFGDRVGWLHGGSTAFFYDTMGVCNPEALVGGIGVPPPPKNNMGGHPPHPHPKKK